MTNKGVAQVNFFGGGRGGGTLLYSSMVLDTRLCTCKNPQNCTTQVNFITCRFFKSATIMMDGIQTMAKNLTVLQMYNISILKTIWNKGADLSNFIKQCFDYKAKDKKTTQTMCSCW